MAWTMSKSFGLAILALTFTLTYVSACTCEDRSNEKKFCNDPFARLFKIVNNTKTEGDGNATVFDVQMLETYRTVPVTNVDETKLYTPTDPAACGITLRKDAYYVVTGKYIENIGIPKLMATGRCNLLLYFASDPRGSEVFEAPECDELERPETLNADDKL